MKTLRILCPLLICLALPLASVAQSLGSVAKKERERRDKNKKEGVAAREITEEEVFGDEDEEAAPTEESAEEAEPGGSPPAEGASIPGVKPSAPDDADPDRESRERKRSEAEWRSKASAARERIEKARERVRFFEELFLGPNERYVDANGNTVIDSVDELQRLTKEAQDELAAAEADWKRMQDDARRAGIPPGWLR